MLPKKCYQKIVTKKMLPKDVTKKYYQKMLPKIVTNNCYQNVSVQGYR